MDYCSIYPQNSLFTFEILSCWRKNNHQQILPALVYLSVPYGSVWREAIDCLEEGTVPSVDRREAFAKEDVGTPEQFGLQGENTLKICNDVL